MSGPATATGGVRSAGRAIVIAVSPRIVAVCDAWASPTADEKSYVETVDPVLDDTRPGRSIQRAHPSRSVVRRIGVGRPPPDTFTFAIGTAEPNASVTCTLANQRSATLDSTSWNWNTCELGASRQGRLDPDRPACPKAAPFTMPRSRGPRARPNSLRPRSRSM